MIPRNNDNSFTEDQIRQQLGSYLSNQMKKEPGIMKSLVSSADKAYQIVHKGKCLSVAQKAVLAQTFNEQRNRLISAGWKPEAITSAAENIADVANPLAMLFNIQSILVPNFTYTRVAGMQPLPTPSSPIFYPTLNAGEDRNNVAKGESLLGSTGWEKTNTFTTNKVIREYPLAASTTTTLTTNYPTAAVPILRNSVTVLLTIAGSSFYAQEDGEGNIIPNVAAGLTGGTVNYSAGTVTLTFATATTAADKAEMTYRYVVSPESNPALAILEWKTKPVDAQPYQVRYSYKIDNMLAAKQVLGGYDIDEVLTTGLAGYINKDISGGVFDDLKARADSLFTWNSALPTGVPWVQHRFSVLQTLIEQSNYIRSRINRSSGNVLTMDMNMSNLLETLGTDVYVPESYSAEPIGPYYHGKLLGRIDCIKNQDYGRSGSVMSYKSSETDASIVGGAFISLYGTPSLSLDTLRTVAGFGTQVGFVKTFNGSISLFKIV